MQAASLPNRLEERSSILSAALRGWLQLHRRALAVLLEVGGVTFAEPQRSWPQAVHRAALISLSGGAPLRMRSYEGRWLIAGRRVPLPHLIAVLYRSTDPPQSRTLDRELAAVTEAALRGLMQQDPFLELLAGSPSLLLSLESLRRTAGQPISTLILGETGTGKEWLARAIHRASGRKGPLIAESCAALPESLLEAEMFGVTRGAFTGATRDRLGRVAEAHGGTLFLDEIGELTPALQVKLLRVLQEREVRPLGGVTRRVDIKLLAATHRPLQQLVESDRFRSDLYYRLAGTVVRIPTLTERIGDLPYLSAAILERLVQEGIGPGRFLAPASLKLLASRRWPGNLRQLDNRLRHAAAVARSPRIVPADLDLPSDERLTATLNLEARLLMEALSISRGVKAEAARRLGWSRQKLYRRLQDLGLPR